jgi:hypothetical protein
MKLVEINWNPSVRQLRQFGVICLFALPLIGWTWNATPTTLGVLVAIGLIVAAASLRIPKAIKPVFLGLCIVAMPIGMVIGELAMLLIFFGVFLPIGLVFRARRRDALQLHFDRNAHTYWQPKKQPASANSYYRRF